MTRERKSSPQTLSLLIALLERPRAWRHGYDLSSETGLPSELEGRPPRRMYRLTSDGLEFARSEVRAAEIAPHGAHARGRA